MTIEIIAKANPSLLALLRDSLNRITERIVLSKTTPMLFILKTNALCSVNPAMADRRKKMEK